MLILLLFVFSGISCYQNERISTTNDIGAQNSKLNPKIGHDAVEAIRKAAKYIIGQVTEDGWGNFTPRAVVGLSFADKVSTLTPFERELMMKHLKSYLMRDLLEMTFRGTKPSLVNIASYINALYATCQDPRNFQGHDLVTLLRSEVDSVMSSNFSYPYVLMSLCLADSINGLDVNRLGDMYNQNSKPGFKALVITAMACIGRQDEDINRRIKKFVEHFFNDSSTGADKMDIYSKALYLQAAIASNFMTPNDIDRYQLKSYQIANGSFGDMLATYSIIPLLLYSSLLDLRCKLPEKKALISVKKFKPSAEHELVYSLWIPSEQGINTHSMIVPFSENANFFDVMKSAALMNPLFKFLYEDTPSGKKIYSLAGIPNDIEAARKWTLYEGHANVTIDSYKYLNEITLGIDDIFPKDKDHFSFCFTR